MTAVLEGHTDSVWSLAYSVTRQQLLSCSADGTVKLWSPANSKAPLVATLGESEEGVPTGCDWVTGEAGHLVVSFSTAACVIYDAETQAVVTRLDTSQDPVSGQVLIGLKRLAILSPLFQPVGPINAVLSHPALPLTITGHEDRHIRFYDNNTGALVHRYLKSFIENHVHCPAWWQIYLHQCLLSSMVAHLDSVTSLAVDQHGLYLISGSHDCSIR